MQALWRNVCSALIENVMKVFSIVVGFYLFALFTMHCQAQNKSGCSDLIKRADSLTEIRSYRAAAGLYFKAFSKSPDCVTNAYLVRAAKVALRSGMVDSTFKALNYIINRKGRTVYASILSEPEFLKLKNDPRWARIKYSSIQYLPAVEVELNALQKERRLLDEKMQIISRNKGINSPDYKVIKDTIQKLDAVNSFKIESIIRTYGWPGVDQIEEGGERSLLYLYQTLGFNDQKKYYPFLAEGFRSGTIDAVNYAAMSDKIAFRDKREQIYGTQLGNDKHLLPFENPDSVNFRRASIGLPPLKSR
jgi:hypothetical protein